MKRKLDGELYVRDNKVEALLQELEVLSRSDLLERCMIRERNDPDYVPSECLLYFVRSTRTDDTSAFFEKMYKVLVARVLRALPNAEHDDGEQVRVSLTKSRIRDQAFGQFVEMLASDRQAYCEKLDYFEVRFDGALASLRRDAQKKAWREENRAAPLEYDAETHELSPEVERASGICEAPDAADYRYDLDAAIAILPEQQRRIVEMFLQGVPIDSKDPGAVTMSKTLGKCEKTVRTHRDLAFTALRATLTLGDQP